MRNDNTKRNALPRGGSSNDSDEQVLNIDQFLPREIVAKINAGKIVTFNHGSRFLTVRRVRHLVVVNDAAAS